MGLMSPMGLMGLMGLMKKARAFGAGFSEED
jgi:hypothetical protein